MSTLGKISLFCAVAIMLVFFSIQTLVVFGLVDHTWTLGAVGYACFLLFCPFFYLFVREYLHRLDQGKNEHALSGILIHLLGTQFQGNFFKEGRISDEARFLIGQVSKAVGVDRCSVWLFDSHQQYLECNEVLFGSTYGASQTFRIIREKFHAYFESLENERMIVAPEVSGHPALMLMNTAFFEPSGVRSLLDLPILFNGHLMGVFRMERSHASDWSFSGINCAQVIATLYSNAYAARQLAQERERLNELEQFLDTASIITKSDASGIITYVNRKFSEVSGYEPEDVIGMNYSILNSGQHPPELWKEMYDTILVRREIWNKVIVNRRKDGTFFHADTFIRAEFDKSTGALKGFTSILQDQTETRRQEQELKHRLSEIEELYQFLDQATIISRTDPKGTITYVNDRFSAISGYSREELIGGNHRIVNSGTHPREFWIDMYRVTLKERGIWTSLVTNRAKDGTLYYVETFIKANFDQSTGKHIGFTSIRQDLSSLKRKELDFRHRMHAINKSNAVIEFDVDGNILYANDRFQDLMEYSMDMIQGKHHRIFVSPAFARSQEYVAFWEKLKSGQFISADFDRYTRTGRRVWMQATYNPIIDAEGNVISIMKIAVDITQRVEQALEIDRKNSYLEHAARILRHDMHSGINVYIPRGLSSLTKRLPREVIDTYSLDPPLRLIREGLAHTQKVYRGVYEFANLVKPGSTLDLKVLDLRDILVSFLSTTSYKDQVDIGILGTANVSEQLFCTAIDNLIRNGLKYNDSPTKIVRISRQMGDVIAVEDNGRGMSQEEFDHFSKTGSRREGQTEAGSGLGLGICVAILKEHGFSITCEKILPTGSSIKIKLT